LIFCAEKSKEKGEGWGHFFLLKKSNLEFGKNIKIQRTLLIQNIEFCGFALKMKTLGYMSKFPKIIIYLNYFILKSEESFLKTTPN